MGVWEDGLAAVQFTGVSRNRRNLEIEGEALVGVKEENVSTSGS